MGRIVIKSETKETKAHLLFFQMKEKLTNSILIGDGSVGFVMVSPIHVCRKQ